MSEQQTIRGRVYVIGDNIDTDQIIPADCLTLVPTIPEEYEKLGSLALSGLPEDAVPLVAEGQMKSEYAIIVAGSNFGCGSSREHAPIALGAAGVQAVVAGSYARIFFRNAIATGELYPLESEEALDRVFQTGDEAEIDLDANRIMAVATEKSYELKPLGVVKPVVDAGGIFGYARETGMIAEDSEGE